MSLADWFHGKKNENFKLCSYVLLACFAALGIIHLFINEFDQNNMDNYTMSNSFYYYLAMKICYAGGLWLKV